TKLRRSRTTTLSRVGKSKRRKGRCISSSFHRKNRFAPNYPRFWTRSKHGGLRWWTGLTEWKLFEWLKRRLNQPAPENGSKSASDQRMSEMKKVPLSKVF